MSAIAIVGQSGTGKSTSIGESSVAGIKGLPSRETVVINVAGKDLPFKGWSKNFTGSVRQGGNYLNTSDPKIISEAITYISKDRPEIKHIVIDDAQYIMAFEFMRRAKESGYGKFADIGVNIAAVVEAARVSRPDLKIYFLWHPEVGADGTSKMKTVGKMVNHRPSSI